MTKIHRNALQSEIGSLNNLLARAAGRDPLGEISLRKRLNLLESDLISMDSTRSNLANVSLVFDGGPVEGSSSIEADFAGKALQDYQELITKHVAVSAAGGMAEKGRLPLHINQQARLNVTALIHGSFGFVLEEDGADEPDMFESPAHKAMQQVTNLLESVASVESRAFETTLMELDVRIFQTLKRFIGILHKANATLRVSEDRREIKLDMSSIGRAYDRVSQVDIEEVTEIFEGELLGLVPIQRRFDFRRGKDGQLIQGRVSINLSADYLERIEKNGIVSGSNWKATILTKKMNHPDGRHSTSSTTLIDLVNISQ